jgi:hypothetical protein
MTYAPGADLAAAFSEAVAAARHEHGHGGYSGSLAEKHGYVVIDRVTRWVDDATSVANQLLDTNDPRVRDKWGPAGAIAVCLPTYTRIVELDGGPWPADSDWASLAADQIAHPVEAARLMRYNRVGGGRYGQVALEATIRRPEAGTLVERAVTVTVDGGRSDNDFTSRLEREVRTKLRLGRSDALGTIWVGEMTVVSAATRLSGSGRATRWVITGDGHHDTWTNGYATAAEARKRLRELAKLPLDGWGRERRYEVQAITRASDGGPIAAVTVSPRRTTVEATVAVHEGRQAPSQPDGWLLFGWASS